jgi:hypothetical protein
MFCSFFDLSGNPPRISPTESMPSGAELRPPLDLPRILFGLFMKQGLQPHIASRSTHPGVIRIIVPNGYGRSASFPLPSGGRVHPNPINSRIPWEDEPGAGEGNRTLVCSLGSCRSTIELRPQTYSIKSDTSRTFGADFRLASWCHRDAGCYPGPLFIDRSSATRQATLRSPSGRRRGLALGYAWDATGRAICAAMSVRKPVGLPNPLVL